MASVGFDVARLVLSWCALEPTPGAFDRAYVARIRDALAAGDAEASGLYVVLDMHQDAWGKHIATPPDERCLPGSSRASAGRTPEWATLTDGLPTCWLSLREVAPAVVQAFTTFWTDRDGIQRSLVRTWPRLAEEFAAEPAVAGHDLLNEPHPGYTPGITGPTLLRPYSDCRHRAIRRAERRAPGGLHHIVFFEPHVVASSSWQKRLVRRLPTGG